MNTDDLKIETNDLKMETDARKLAAKRESFKAAIAPILVQSGLSGDGLFERYTQFVEELANFVIHQSNLLFPEKGISVLMAMMASSELNNTLREISVRLMLKKLAGPLMARLNTITPERIAEMSGGEMNPEEAKEALEMAKKFVAGDFDLEAVEVADATRGQRPN